MTHGCETESAAQGYRGVIFQNGTTLYDPKDPMAKLFFTILAAVAEAEGGWISLRTREAMARPKVRAKLKGRRPNLTERGSDDHPGSISIHPHRRCGFEPR